MVWKPKKGRRLNKSVVPANNTSNSRQLKSCLKAANASGQNVGDSSIRSGDHSASTPTSRDQSTKSARSILSVFSTRSKETPPPQEDGPSNQNTHRVAGSSNVSRSSGDSRLSKSSLPKSSQHSTTHTASSAPMDKTVRFGEIQIREHERVVGDNPSCSTGPPIS